MQLIEFTYHGLYCRQADVYIDAHRAVPKAIVTHAHSDHARPGHKSYICTTASLALLKLRLGRHIQAAGVNYGETFLINGVTFSFHPAGHVIGSAQLRVEYKGEVWVISGDYKRENDGLTEAFEPVACHTFITESTFGLPIFNWRSQEVIAGQMLDWWQHNASLGLPSMVSAYSLGKAQRIMHMIAHAHIGPVYVHNSIHKTNEVLRKQGINLSSASEIDPRLKADQLANALIIAPGTAKPGQLSLQLKHAKKADASGWMALRKFRQNHPGAAFVLSDHADWLALNQTIKDTGAERIFVTHGYQDSFAKWLSEKGYDAHVVGSAKATEFIDED
ncbi:MAG: ligase-associated DNA damage response exonuclease [Saprospiraceae bacterium]|nr:ligase-associated DNA damage response exonuclease [Saprospiraceae bacterium]